MDSTCYYRSYRDEKGDLSPFYWKLLVIRLSFVVIFEVIIKCSRHLNVIDV